MPSMVYVKLKKEDGVNAYGRSPAVSLGRITTGAGSPAFPPGCCVGGGCVSKPIDHAGAWSRPASEALFGYQPDASCQIRPIQPGRAQIGTPQDRVTERRVGQVGALQIRPGQIRSLSWA